MHKDKIKIIAITCVYGNTEEINVELNVLKTLTIAKRSDVSAREKNPFYPILNFLLYSLLLFSRKCIIK